MMLPATSLLVAASAIFLVLLSVGVIRQRRQSKAAIGNPTQDPSLERKIRAQGNFTEYMPLLLLAVALIELQGFSKIALMLGSVALLGRCSHAYGLLKAEPEHKDFRWRVAGMVVTFSCLTLAALTLLVIAMFL